MNLRLIVCALGLLTLNGCSSLHTVGPESNRQWPSIEPDQRFADLSRLVTGKQGSEASFALELAAFRSDSTYPCRHPTYAYFYAQRLGKPLDYGDCPPTVPFYLLDQEQGGYQVLVAPDLVRSIHILFASGGDSVASRFGHVSIRLIVCPDRAASDLECNENLFEHVVLGYVARINELEMSLVKGVMGGYDAHLTGFSFVEAYRTNTVLADRNLYSVPLNLSREETEQIVRELSEIHWSFRGDYRFFTRNCATLLQDTLATVLDRQSTETDLDDDLETGFLRPDSFFEALERSDRANHRVLASLEKAEREGYFFPSTRPYYEQAFELVSRIAGWTSPESLEDYFHTPSKTRLLKTLQSDQLMQTYGNDQHAREAHLLLEERVLMGLEQARLQSLMNLLGDPDMMGLLQGRLEATGDNVDQSWFERCVRQPLRRLQGQRPVSKGIPEPEFMTEFPVAGRDCRQHESLMMTKRLVNDWLPDDHQSAQALRAFSLEIEQTHENLAYLRTL